MRVLSTIAALAVSYLGLAAAQAHPHQPGAVPENPYEPLQHRLAYAGPTGMTVSWNTFIELKDPLVYYGTDPLRLTQIAYGTSTTYKTSRTWNNHVVIHGLKPYTKYYYRVQYTNCQGCSTLPTYSFTVSMPAGDHTSYRMGVVIDLGVMGENGLSTRNGTGPDQSSVQPLGLNETNSIQSLNQFADAYDFLMHPGDMAYADYWVKMEIQNYLPGYVPGAPANVTRYETILESYFDELQPITARKPYMVGMGNHEANCDNGNGFDSVNNITYGWQYCFEGQTNFTGYRNHFRMPGTESGGNANFWYSFDYGMAHFVMLDSETDLGNGIIGPDEPGGSQKENGGPFGRYPNEQLDFVKRDLASVNRTATPWVIVMFHRPYYASVQNKTSLICTDCKNEWEDLFYQNGVDLVMNGHVHNYQRQFPVYKGVADANGMHNPKAPMYIMNGLAGQFDGPDPIQYPLQPYTAYAENTVYGWSLLSFHNATHLTHEFVMSGNGTIGDTATLIKDHGTGLISGSGSSSGCSTVSTVKAIAASPATSSPVGSAVPSGWTTWKA